MSVSKSEMKVPINKKPASEPMASKTCPICKTFSSASNTTLNAHIDQCLSADSVLPTTKPNRQSIKPRRVRTMTDIYATAKGCTLEELDKRNGTMWAMISSHSNRVAKHEVFRKGKKRKVLPARLDEDAVGVGPVYVNARGKKLQILSEFRENKDVCLKKKSSQEGIGGKWSSTQKKNCKVKKHHKYLRLITQSRKLVSHKDNASEIPEYQEGYSGQGSGMERRQTPKTLKPSQPRIAERTGLSRKLNMKGHKFHVSPDQPIKTEVWLGDPILSRSRTHDKLTDMSVSVSSSRNKQKTWRTCGESKVAGNNETLFRRKSAQSFSFRVQITKQVQSSQDQLDLTDRCSSESSLSAVSTHSDSTAVPVRSTHANLQEKCPSAEDMITCDHPTSFSMAYPVVPMDSTATSQQANAEAERTFDTGKFSLCGITFDKRSFPFRSNGQPCCFQRKERFPEGFTVNHQESRLLKQRAASSITNPETSMPSCVDPNIMLSNSDTFLDTFKPYIFKDLDLHSKFPNSMNRAATNPSNTVLRLMGKDLMVVNQGEEAPTPASHNESSLRHTPEFLDPSGPSESSIQTFHHGTPHHSSALLQSPCPGTNIYSGTGLYYGNNTNSATPHTPTKASAADAFCNSFGLVRYYPPS